MCPNHPKSTLFTWQIDRQVSGEDSSNPSWTPGSSNMVHIQTMVGEAKIQFAGGHHEFCLDMLVWDINYDLWLLIDVY